MPELLRRLPGIAFEALSAPSDDVLPRMDVAGFVGFARTGPVGVPVAVADLPEFEAIFGASPVLLRDGTTGEEVVGHLADAVAAFFRNGGWRCWVVRVSATATRATVPVPGLVRLDEAGRPVPVELRAVAVGAETDGLQVTASLRRSARVTVTLDSVTPAAGGRAAAVRGRVGAGGALRTGDLVRVALADGLDLLFAVTAATGAAIIGTGPLCVSTAPHAGRAELSGTPVEVLAEGVGVDTLLRLPDAVTDVPGPGLLAPLRLLPDDGDPAPAAEAVFLVTADPHRDPTGGRRLRGRLFRLAALPTVDSTALPAEVLTFALRVRVAERPPVDLDGLGFAADHPRFVGDLPTDEELHAARLTADDRPPPQPALWAQVANPRFPLAGPETSAPVLYPLGLGAVTGPAPRAGTPDDLVSGFTELLFLDEALARVGTDALLATADFVRDTSARPRPLTGIHALLDVDEVTLVAVPDAVHRSWAPADPAPQPPPPPHEPYSPPRPCPHGGTGTFADCAGPAFTLPDDPVLAPEVDDLGTVHLTWPPVREAQAPVRYVLEESTDPSSWADATELHRGPRTAVTLHGRGPGTYFYRVRAEDDAGRSSDWWQGLAVTVLPSGPGAAPAPFDAAVLRLVHAALVRMCAARGDLLAVLSLPQHYRADEAVAHVAAVRGEIAPGGATDDRTLSFGALYHPWVRGGRPIPPDGAATGVLAGTALRRGCWVAPANTPLQDVVAVAPPAPSADLQRLQDNGVNTVRQVPRGFLWLAADTLCTDPDLRQITSRRLLSLLRRAALKHGPVDVFEPHGEVLRRRVRRRFEAIMNRLLTQGAFAGPGPQESFRVAVASPPNTPRTADAGQLVVELKVAPSVPLRFLTVRLARAGDGALSVEGV